MDTVDIFIQDLHSQMFYNGTFINPTRFFLLSAIIMDGDFKPCYNKCELERVVYAYYADNDYIAKRHPRAEIRNLKKYGISIIKEEVKLALENWVNEAKSDLITYDLKNVFVKCDKSYANDITYVQMVIEELFKKTFHCDYPSVGEIKGEDTNIDLFGVGPYKNHLTADMQYCVCCDDYRLNNLVAVHILSDAESQLKKSREDVNNGLIMCKEHAQEYHYGRFYFSPEGKVINVSSCLIQRNMRLGRFLLTEERKTYLKEAYINKTKKH